MHHPHSHYQSTDLKPLFDSIMLKPISTWFLAIETAMLQLYSKVYQYVLKKNSLAYTSQNSPNLFKPLPMNSVFLQRNLRAVQFSDILKPHRIAPVKFPNKPSEVTYELLTQDLKAFHRSRNHSIRYNPKKPLLFPHVQSYNESNPEIIHDFEISNLIQKDIYTL